MFEKTTLVIDIDGTLCPIKKSDEAYIDLVPYKDVVGKIKEYKASGATIVLFTARNMRTHDGRIGLINADTAKVLLAWLDKWEIEYDEIIYGKPWPDRNGFYVDDRTVRPDEFLKHSHDELLEICRKSREGLS